MTLVRAYVSWRNADTFDIFKQVWSNNGLVLFDQKEVSGIRWNEIRIEAHNLPSLLTDLKRIESLSSIRLSQDST